MELAVLIRRTMIVAAVAYAVIMFPPIITTHPDIGLIGGKPTGLSETSRDFIGAIPSSDDDFGTGVKIEIDWGGYLLQLAVAPAVWFLLFRRKKQPPAWQADAAPAAPPITGG